jgi:hypothetical protein
MCNTGLENAASVHQFSEKDKNYFAYQARQNYLRQQMSVYGELDATKLREQQALAKLDAVTAEIEKLKALLATKQS